MANSKDRGFWLRIVALIIFAMVAGAYTLLYAGVKEDIKDNTIKIEKLDESKADEKYMDDKFEAQKELMQSEFRAVREMIQGIRR